MLLLGCMWPAGRHLNRPALLYCIVLYLKKKKKKKKHFATIYNIYVYKKNDKQILQSVKQFIIILADFRTPSSPVWLWQLGSPGRLQERLPCHMTQHCDSCLSKMSFVSVCESVCVCVCVFCGGFLEERVSTQKEKRKISKSIAIIDAEPRRSLPLFVQVQSFDWPHCVFVWIATHHFIIEETHTHTNTHTLLCIHAHTAMITILHITGVQITAWLPWACQSTVIPQTLWIFISNKSSTARRHKEAFCCLLCVSFFFFFFPRPHFCRRLSTSFLAFQPLVPASLVCCICEIQYRNDKWCLCYTQESPNSTESEYGVISDVFQYLPS